MQLTSPQMNFSSMFTLMGLMVRHILMGQNVNAWVGSQLAAPPAQLTSSKSPYPDIVDEWFVALKTRLDELHFRLLKHLKTPHILGDMPPTI